MSAPLFSAAQQAEIANLVGAAMAMKVFIQEYLGNFTLGEDQITAYFKCTTGEAQNLILQHMDPVFASEFTCAADVLRVLDQRFFDHNYSWRPTATATSPAPRTRSPSPAAHRERSASPKPSSGLCYNCGAPGHYATDCPKPKKQGDRGKDSYYGIGHNLWKDLDFDSRLLIGGRQFLVPVELARNGSFIKTVAHIDGGANIFGIIKTSLAYQLSQRLGVKFIKLPKPITPTGYNGLEGETIRFAVLLTLTIDRRRINFPFLITSLGATDVLIGRKFLEHYDLKQSYGKGKNRISWPKDMPIVPYFDRRVLIDLSRPTKPLMA
ncbi:unnamed protein product [Diplocarpon coronariae]